LKKGRTKDDPDSRLTLQWVWENHYMQDSKCSWNHFIFRNTQQHSHLTYISLCNCTLPPGTVKVLETFLEETILWKPLQLVRLILNVNRITEAPSLLCWFRWREQIKISWNRIRRVWGMLQRCHIVLRQQIFDQNWPVRRTIVQENRAAGSPFFGAFLSDRIPKATKDVNVRSLFTVAIPANYSSEFRELLERTT
jgi:hypothetical protein